MLIVLSEWSTVQVSPDPTKGYVVLPNGTLTNTEFSGFGGWLGMLLSVCYLSLLFKGGFFFIFFSFFFSLIFSSHSETELTIFIFIFLACDWSHYNTTQLFWKYNYLFKEPSANCKEVELVVEYKE